MNTINIPVGHRQIERAVSLWVGASMVSANVGIMLDSWLDGSPNIRSEADSALVLMLLIWSISKHTIVSTSFANAAHVRYNIYWYFGASVRATPGGYTCTQRGQSRDIEKNIKSCVTLLCRGWIDRCLFQVFNLTLYLLNCGEKNMPTTWADSGSIQPGLVIPPLA